LREVKKIPFAIGALALAHLAATHFLNPYHHQVVILIGINVILAVSLNLINGFAGQFSIGHAGFMALGAYGSAVVSSSIAEPLIALLAGHVPGAEFLVFALQILLAGSLAAVAGVLVGIPTLRLRGDYLAIATLGFGEIIRVLILNLDFVGGARGFSNIREQTNFFFVYGSVALVIAVVGRSVNSTWGRGFLALARDEIAAEAIGINTTRLKVIAFTVGSFFAGVAGCLFAHFMTYLHPNSFTFLRSIEIIVMVVVGGMGSILGSVLGAALLTLLPELLRFMKDYRMVIYALALIVLMISRPEGMLGRSTKSRV
jgi:branched-chain amino acid transport system permease protein